MDLLKLLGIGPKAQKSSNKQQLPPMQHHFPTPGFYEQAVQGQMGYPGGAEDDAMVRTPQGRMPLSSVTPGQQWQNPDSGYSPNGYNPLSVQPAYAPRPGAQGSGLQQSTSFDGNLQGGNPSELIRRLLGR